MNIEIIPLTFARARIVEVDNDGIWIQRGW